MSNILNPSAIYTQPQDFARKIGAFLFESTIAQNTFSSFIQLYSDIIYNTAVPFVNAPGPLLGAPEACGSPIVGKIAIGGSQKVWIPTEISFNASQCYQDLQKEVTAILIKYQFEPWKLADSPLFMQFMGTIFSSEVFNSEHFRLYFLSDTALVAANFTGANAALVEFYTRIDGFYKQIFAEGIDVSLSAPLLTALNLSNDWAAMMAALAADDTIGHQAIKALVNNSDSRLNTNKEALIGLTDELWMNYNDFLSNRQNSTGQTWLTDNDNRQYLPYNGYKVVRMSEVSAALKRDFRVPPTVGAYDPTNPEEYRIVNAQRAIMFTPKQMGVAVDGKGIIDNFYINPNPSTRVLELLGSFQTDAKIGWGYMFAFAL